MDTQEMTVQEATQHIERFFQNKDVTVVVEAIPDDGKFPFLRILLETFPCDGRLLIAKMYITTGVPFGIEMEYGPKEGISCPYPDRLVSCPFFQACMVSYPIGGTM